MPVPSTDKVKKLLLKQIESGEYYAAHLKARSTVARLIGKSEERDEKSREAESLLAECARALFTKSQNGSGADLSLYLLQVWQQKNVVCGSEERGIIMQLIVLAGRTENWRQQIISHAISWSAKTGQIPIGDLELHAQIGEILAKEKAYDEAEPHLIASASRDSARTYAQIMFDWSSYEENKIEALGRYAARAVFSYLDLHSLQAAFSFLTHFIQLVRDSHPDFQTKAVDLPSNLSAAPALQITNLASLNFLQLTLLSCQIGAGIPISPSSTATNQKGAGRQAWQALTAKYEKEVSWLQAPEAKEALSMISEVYFGIKAGKGGDLLSSLMGNLFGGASTPAPAPRATASITQASDLD